ncbi:putative RNA-directed DNA polymerase [Tanacetum coccineum]|uniref:RNA-directed DNA polymerase n=1 Tax=Tanacetum coccineum TaxID=301880 RepID=A0ABQ4XSU1_9ASTR
MEKRDGKGDESSHKEQHLGKVYLAIRKKTVGCRWVFTIKYKPDGTIERYKARLVAKGDDKEEITKLKKNLFTEFEMKDRGNLKYFLETEVLRSKQGIFMHQRKYVCDLLAETAYAVGVVSQFMHQPQKAYIEVVLRIVRYLKGTAGHGILFKPNGHLETQLYTDADWAGDKNNRRSTLGYFTLVGRNLVTWRSKKQKVVALSSAETEFCGITRGITEVLWVRKLLTEKRYTLQESSKVLSNNKAAIQISSNPVQLNQIKHIEDYGSNKAFGPNGFTFAFVKKYRDLIKMDILEFVNSFFDSCSMPQGANSSFFTLIPKIRACLHSSKAFVLVTGIPTSEFFIKRGLRQGDLLAPFLFILIMEGLHCSLSAVVSSNLIHGINLGSPNLTLSHIFYADNVIIITEWNPCDLDNIICDLHVFYLASSLKININKSNIYGIGVSDDEVSNMARNSGCVAGSFPFTYLGFLIGSTMIVFPVGRL